MEIPKDRKMSFIEFVAYQESDEEMIEDSWLLHWKMNLKEMLNEENSQGHMGDCTKEPFPCHLCTLETCPITITLKDKKQDVSGDK